MKSSTRCGALVMLMAFCNLLISCGKEDVTLDGFSHTISGSVYDSLNSQPIDSALVTWGDTINMPVVKTDSSGAYQIEIPVGNTTIFARKQGYNTKWRYLADIKSDITGVDFPMVQTR